MLTIELKSEIKEYSLSFPNEEICGLLIKQNNIVKLYKCRNISHYKENHCILNPMDYVRASESGKIIAHIHSQKDRYPSFVDYLNAINHNIYSIIYSTKYDKFSIIEPSLKEYLNLNYEIGKNDCFELVRNYYKKELNINISNYHRYEKWEFDKPNMMLDNYEKEGFLYVDLEDIRKNDVIIFDIFGYPSHLGIFLGNNFILHHPENDKSVICEISQGLTKRINTVIRHKDLNE